MEKNVYYSLICFLLSISLVGCNNFDNSFLNNTNEQVELIISAAASLKDSLNEIEKLYSQKNPNVKVTFNFGSSGTLEQQIEQGAPADVFIPAGEKQMDALSLKKLLLENSRKNVLKNDIVLVVPKDSNLKGFENLKTHSVKKVALGEPKTVPIGQYSEEILKYFNIYDEVTAKAVYGKDVKEVLTWVEGGNADAGIVYKTDALTSQNVKVVATAPSESHSEVLYPAAVVKASKFQDVSKDFLNYLSSKEAKGIFLKYGFITN